MKPSEYSAQDGLGLAELIRSGQVSATEVAEAALDAIDRLNPTLNCVLESYRDRVPPAGEPVGDAPFAGVPFLLKDIGAHEAGATQEMGSRLARGLVFPHDSELAARFKRAGLRILGRTMTPEFGYCSSAETVAAGSTRNPWDTERTPGGSSGGSAAAVAAGVVPLAHGNDGGGSIRIPAAWCGLVGLKPTRMRNPLGPDYAELLMGMAVEHCLSRTVRDTAALLDATHGPDVGAYYVIPPPERPFLEEVASSPGRLRIGFTATPWAESGPVDPGCVAETERIVQVLRDLGHELEEASFSIDAEGFTLANARVWSAAVAGMADEIGAALGRTPDETTLEPGILACYRLGREVRATEVEAALGVFNSICRTFGAFFEDHDVLLTPTTAVPAPELGILTPNDPRFDALSWTQHIFAPCPFTATFNVTGQPAISLPLCESASGLPIGMQFVGRFADEATLLRLAGQLEKELPWDHRRPRVHLAS
jgi:amidase